MFAPNPGYVINHLAKHPESSSFILAKNGETLISYQADKRRPLASTMKIIIAVEYAEQAAAGKIDPQQKVSLDEPNRFYLKNTDGGAHSAWLEKMKEDNRIDGGQVTLHDIAKGMIRFSSNANTDYLLNVLGVDLVNERIKKLGLEGHEPLYPIVSSLLVPNQLKNEDMDENELESLLRDLSNKEYREITLKINQEIQSGGLQLSGLNSDESPTIERVWSDRLPRATANDYYKLLVMINEDDTFSDDKEKYLRDLLEWPMEKSSTKERFVHFGGKGGSTTSVLTQALYAEDHEGNTYELIMLAEDMSLLQLYDLQGSYDYFLDKIFDEPDYWKKVQEKISS
ncbi:serine hydrolase [Solibacillus sp. CAU 1738]|uniref:serine hydrolase n=1 Tax=Solibacillus sp. CAU 1738 TaxID=3140363 RepID=UPI0032613FD7